MEGYYAILVATLVRLFSLTGCAIAMSVGLEKVFSKKENNLATIEYEDNFIQALL